MNLWPYDTPGIPDHLFIKDKSPITREEIRAIIIDKLRLTKEHVLVDVGAGTGAIVIEAARIITKGEIFAVEAKPERVALIEANLQKFEVNNVKVIKGTAPEALVNLSTFDRVFIGGSAGKLREIIELLGSKLKPDGRLVMTAVTLETLNTAVNILSQPPFKHFNGLAVNLAELKTLQDYHLFQPEHPVHVLTAVKN